MPNFQLQDSQKVPYALIETDSVGNQTTPGSGDSFSVVSSDPDSLTVVADATPTAGALASGFLVAGKKLQVGVTVTATANINGTSINAVDTIDIVGGVASSISISLGSPIPQ